MRRAAGIVALVLAAGAIAVAVSGAGGGGDARVDRWVPLRSAGLARTEVAAARVGSRSTWSAGSCARAMPRPRRSSATTSPPTAGRAFARCRSGVDHPAATSYAGDVYVVGGYTADRALAGETAAFLRYDPESNRWTRLPDMPTARAALAVGVIGDRLYAAGGATSAGTTFKRLEVFNFTTRRWSRGPDMQVPREHIAGAVSGGGFYVLGGRPGNLAVAERYVPARRRWERLPDLRTARSGIAAATVGRLVVVFGGERSAGDDPPRRGVRPAHAPLARTAGMRTPRHGLGGAPSAAACTRSKAARSPGSPSRARSKRSTCPRERHPGPGSQRREVACQQAAVRQGEQARTDHERARHGDGGAGTVVDDAPRLVDPARTADPEPDRAGEVGPARRLAVTVDLHGQHGELGRRPEQERLVVELGVGRRRAAERVTGEQLRRAQVGDVEQRQLRARVRALRGGVLPTPRMRSRATGCR